MKTLQILPMARSGTGPTREVSPRTRSGRTHSRTAGVVVLLLALVVLGGRTDSYAACSIVFNTPSNMLLGALQVEIDYAGAEGQFTGNGHTVDCTDLSGSDAMTANDDDATRILRIGWISIYGIDGPAQLVRCTFVSSSGTVDASAIRVEVVDASDPNFVPVSPSVRVDVSNCLSSGSLCGDVNSDGNITSNDSLLVLNAAVGLDAPLNCSGIPGPVTTTTTTTTTMPSVNWELRVDKLGSGAGGVTSDPAGINCGTRCVTTYPDATRVALTASPAAGSQFMGWNGNVPAGCKDPSSTECSVRMTRDRAITATFTTVASSCPTNGPIRDLREDCSSRAYIYANPVEVAALTTDGVDIPIVLVPPSGGEGAAVLGEVTGARTLRWTTACLLDAFGNVEVCGVVPGTGSISSTGQTLTLVLDGDSFRYDFVRSAPLQTAGLLGGVALGQAVTRLSRVAQAAGSILEDTASARSRGGLTRDELVRRLASSLLQSLDPAP